MNVQRLKTLANVIEQGTVTFPELMLTVAFNLETEFVLHNDFTRKTLPKRKDIPYPEGVGAAADFTGFSILLFSPLRWTMHRYPFDFNIHTEAKLLLDLTDDQAKALFYGRSNRYITGAEAARVVNKLLLTEKVDWSIVK